jgi:hypothetical protein
MSYIVLQPSIRGQSVPTSLPANGTHDLASFAWIRPEMCRQASIRRRTRKSFALSGALLDRNSHILVWFKCHMPEVSGHGVAV